MRRLRLFLVSLLLAAGLNQPAAALPRRGSRLARPSLPAHGAVQPLLAPPPASGGALRAAPRAAEGQRLEGIVAATRSREFPGVFIQQEQEGSLVASDPRDSSGDVFAYYRPVELRGDLLEGVLQSMGFWENLSYGLRSLSHPLSRGRPENIWEAMSLGPKTRYLGRYEAAVKAEKGDKAAWDYKSSLLLERRPDAPGYIARHPDMESPPAGLRDEPGAAFLQPEIVTAKDSPARTIDEAVERTKSIIADTGHAGTQYHVFVKAPPARLAGGLSRLGPVLQAVNDMLFLEAVQESPDNLFHAVIKPWHAGRSKTVARLVAKASPDRHNPDAADPDNEKYAFLGLRYWGLESGRMALSFELRGTAIPWKSDGPSGARGIEGAASRPRRDFRRVERHLALLMHLARGLGNGGLPASEARELKLEVGSAEKMIRQRAGQRGLPKGALPVLEAVSKSLAGASGGIHPALLYPFAWHVAYGGSPAALEAYIDEVLNRFAAIQKAGPESGSDRAVLYQFWESYAAWSRQALEAARGRYESLLRAAAI